MIRGFVAGLFWGCIVAAFGLGVLSLGTPLTLPLQPALNENAALDPAVVDPAPAEPPAAVVADPPAVVAVEPPDTAAPAVDPEVLAPEPEGASLPALDEPVEAPTAATVPELPAPAGETPPPPAQSTADTAPRDPDQASAPAGALPELAPAGPVLLPVVPPGLLPAPVPDVVAEPVPAAEPAPAVAPEAGRSARLPRIGDAPAEPVPAIEPPPAAESALLRNARAFANPAGKPTFAVLLLDTGDSATDLATLAAADLPITLLIDPMAEGAAERAALWHAGGQEVALLTSGLPRKGGAADFEVALEGLANQFPQALALVDSSEAGLQGDRMTASALVPALQARGYGLVTWERGLNAADQVARREGLAAATVFRDLDSGDEAAPVIRRYLDRAAFKAQQDGRVVVLGRLRPETVTALLEWGLDGRAASLALAPLSALLTVN